MSRFAVIGAGVAGLAAAWELGRNGAEVVVFEATHRIGGKLRTTSMPGLEHPLDEAADAFLARVPYAIEVCEALHLDDLVSPATSTAWVWTADGLHRLPSGQLLGLPTDIDELRRSGLVSADGTAMVETDLDSTAPPVAADVSVGALIRGRLGDEVCDHVVEPLLGGINAGVADRLSLAATAPQIWECARAGGSLVAAARAQRARAAAGPVFLAPAGGMAVLTDRLAAASGAELRLATPVTSLTAGGGHAHVHEDRFDGVVVAAPPAPAAAMLAQVAPDAAAVLGAIESASVVMVSVVADRTSVDHDLDGSGVVVARTAGLRITATSWGSSKWAHWGRPDQAVFRISIGYDGDPTDWCGRPDDELVAIALEDLGTVLGVAPEAIEVTGTRVTRWAHSFPQYRPGHLDRVRSAREAVAAAGPFAIAGAALDGLGVPACIRQGREAAQQLLG